MLILITPLYAQHSVQWTHELTNLPEDFNLEVATVDRKDRLWLANHSGLWVFDGIDCRSIKQFELSSTVSSVDILSLDSIALGTKNGAIYLLIDQHMDTIPCGINGPISDIHMGENGSVWISSSYDGIYYWDGKECIHLTEGDGLPSDNISGIALDEKGEVWLATDNGLSNIHLGKDNSFRFTNYGADHGLNDRLLTSVEFDKKSNRIFVSTHSKGVFSFKEGIFLPLIEKSNLMHTRSVEFINSNKLLIQADSPAISIYDLSDKKLSHIDVDGILLHPALYTKEGLVWFFTGERQLQQKSIYFTKFNTPHTPQAILSNEEAIWIGTQKGLYKSDPTSNLLEWKQMEAFQGENIISLEFMQDRILIGTFGNGLFLFDPENGNTNHFTMDDGLPDQSILDIFKDGDQVWLGTLGGLVLTKWNIDKIADVSNYVDTVYVYHIDKVNDRIYFSTHGDGAGYINGEIQWFQDSLLSSGEISTFGLLEGDRSLFVTAKNGLIYHHSGKNLKINTPTNISFETTSSIVADSISQRFFISHTNGLDIFNPADSSIIHLGNNLQLNFSTSALNAHSYDPIEKKHFFGSAGGFFCIEPNLYTLRSSPYLNILSCQVNNENRPISYLNNLGSNERTLQLELLPIWYTDPRAIIFRYKIAGLHENWIQTTDPKLIFTDLPYGNYELFIQAGTYGDFSEQTNISIPLQISYPIWMRWWFIISALALILVGIYVFIKNREAKLQRWARLEQEKANAQIQALKSQVSPHFMFNSFNTLIALIEEAPAKAVVYAENLSDFFRNLVSKRNMELNSLEEEVEMVHAYIHLLKTRFEESLQAKIDIENWDGYIITYTLQILTENVVKHNIISRTQPLEFRIYRESDYIILENKLQPKITREESTGFGLESIRDRYKLLYQKDIIIHQTDECFKVKVPIIQK